MNMNYPQNNLLILIFIALFLIVYIISQNDSDTKKEKTHKNIVRPSYGDEFYNYRGGDRIKIEPEVTMNTEEQVYETHVEGFTGNTIEDDIILQGHSKCPVRDKETEFTSCIHYPNKVIRGFGNIVDYGFLVSFSGRSSLDAIQKSLDNQGDYDIIFENNKFFLTKNNIQKQVLLECNSNNLHRVKQLVDTRNIN